MDWQLDAAEVRVLGALLEKEIATPEYYPLSLNALVNACNQKSNREPVVAYDESTVEDALEGLRQKSLATRLTGRDIRVPKHAQRFTEELNLGRREAALLCLLFLRGPQTVGELRGRSDRLYQFDDLEAVDTTLHHLSELGLVIRLSRYAGSREARWAHLLAGQPDAGVEEGHPSAPPGQAPIADRIAQLEREMAALRLEFDEFRKRFE
ncbi:MAG: YceH family protein [Bryobacteraceae bacterium]|jgi:uncharacterized protein YceH (UPF0502 family)